MLARLLKQGMPRSLGGRTTLILLVPVVTILIVLSVVVFQRLYEGVARQMTSEVIRQMRVVLASDAPTELGHELGLQVAPDQRVEGYAREWSDLSGRSVIATLEAAFPDLTGVDLTGDLARIGLDRAEGPVVISVSRARLTARNPHQFLVVLGLTALLMTLIAWLYLRGQVRPIKRLAVAAEAFGKGRVITYRPSGATEVRAAGGAFVEMRERIERQTRQRTQFLSGVSHDLRTPLTRLRLALGMMEDDAEVADMRRDVTEMEEMLDAFLAFARADAEDDWESVEPVEVARDALSQAARGGIAVEQGRMDEGGLVRISVPAVARALQNLIGNADRYATRQRLSVILGDDVVEYRVEDDGPGIAPGDREDAVRPFVRLDRARNQDRGAGTGLGLAIAEDVMRRHGGQLVLSDSRDMGGLMASLVLPR